MSAPTSSSSFEEGYAEFEHPRLPSPAKTYYRIYGDLTSSSNASPLILLHGGPGCNHSYMLSITALSNTHAIPVIVYDQIGNGLSTHYPEKLNDGAFWAMDLFIAELENLLSTLQIYGDFDLLGHSWGGMLAASFAIDKQPQGLRRLIIADSLPSMELWSAGTTKLLQTLPIETQETIRRCEEKGDTSGKEYEDATMEFYTRFLCRCDPWPEELVTSLEWMTAKDATVYSTTMGPSEFHIIGSYKDWNIIDQLHKIQVPTLLINGRYDEAVDKTMAPFFWNIQGVKWVTFSESSHVPHWEEKERYLEVVGEFLGA